MLLAKEQLTRMYQGELNKLLTIARRSILVVDERRRLYHMLLAIEKEDIALDKSVISELERYVHFELKSYEVTTLRSLDKLMSGKKSVEETVCSLMIRDGFYSQELTTLLVSALNTKLCKKLVLSYIGEENRNANTKKHSRRAT